VIYLNEESRDKILRRIVSIMTYIQETICIYKCILFLDIIGLLKSGKQISYTDSSILISLFA
jgi:hypothetical protein